MKFVFTLFSICIVILAFANPVDSVRSEQREEGLFVVHEVEEEETIYSLAKRYKGSVDGIVRYNQIVDNRIEIGQVIVVLVENSELPSVSEIEGDSINLAKKVHVVRKGETLYSISKKYDLKLKDLRKWNEISNNDLSLGMKLRLSNEAILDDPDKGLMVKPILYDTLSTNTEITKPIEEKNPFEGFEEYLVQTGETLSTIAGKIGVGIDSLRIWNDLREDYLKIGQQLFFRPSDDMETATINAPKGKTRTQIDENGFERIYEEGVASVIQSMKTTRYLALHRTLPIGTNLEVRNLMNNQTVHVKVVGRLPDTGINKNLLLRLSEPAYDQLGILDSKSRVEVSYNKE